MASARASATRWRSPPESAARGAAGELAEADRLERRARPLARGAGGLRRALAGRARRCRARTGRRPAPRPAARSRRFARAARARLFAGQCGEVVAGQRDARRGRARSRPAIRCSSVVLPQPDGPTSAWKAPALSASVDAPRRRRRSRRACGSGGGRARAARPPRPRSRAWAAAPRRAARRARSRAGRPRRGRSRPRPRPRSRPSAGRRGRAGSGRRRRRTPSGGRWPPCNSPVTRPSRIVTTRAGDVGGARVVGGEQHRRALVARELAQQLEDRRGRSSRRAGP